MVKEWFYNKLNVKFIVVVALYKSYPEGALFTDYLSLKSHYFWVFWPSDLSSNAEQYKPIKLSV